MVVSLLRALAVGALCSQVASPASPADLEGDWAGWAYGGDFDFPLRLTWPGGDDPPLFWTPASDSLRMPVERTEPAGDGWTFTGETPKGDAFRFEASLAGDRLLGEGSIGDELSFDWELVRSARPIAAQPAGAPELVEGVFADPSGRCAFVSSRFWGELVVDVDGRRRTPFPLADGGFFVGPALYDPSSVEALVRFDRDDAGRAVAVEVRDGSDVDRFERLELVESPLDVEHEHARLRGTLVAPARGGPFPAVVLVGGSDWTTRDGQMDTARRFAAMGVAALAWDKRGSGESTGGALEWFPLTAGDAAALAGVLRARGDVDPDRVGFFGVSRGGWTAPLAATMLEDAAFVVALVAPAVSPQDQERTRRLALLRAGGASDRELALAGEYLDAQFAYANRGAGWDAYAELRREVDERGWLDALLGPADPFDLDWAWSRLNGTYDPVLTIERLASPTLVVLGGSDESVVPEQNEPRWRAALERAPTDDWSVEVLAGADHGLRAASPDRTRIHDSVGTSPELWPLLAGWLRTRLGLRAPTPATGEGR